MACRCFDKQSKKAQGSIAEKIAYYTCHCNARFLVEEKKRTFILKDASLDEVDKIKIDGAVIDSSQTDKCDFLFIYRGTRYFFVELKGQNISHALDQIDGAMQILFAEGIIKQKETRGCIVFSSYPRDNGSYRKKVLTLQKKWKNKVADLRIFQTSTRMEFSASKDELIK